MKHESSATNQWEVFYKVHFYFHSCQKKVQQPVWSSFWTLGRVRLINSPEPVHNHQDESPYTRWFAYYVRRSTKDSCTSARSVWEPFIGWSPSGGLPNGRLSSRFIGPMVLPIFTRQYNSEKQLHAYVHLIWLSTEIRTTARNYFWFKPFSKTKRKCGVVEDERSLLHLAQDYNNNIIGLGQNNSHRFADLV